MKKLPFTLGVEMTAVPTIYNSYKMDYVNNDDYDEEEAYTTYISDLSGIINYEIGHTTKLKKLFNDIGYDSHAIEMSSKILKTRAEYKKFSKEVRSIWKKYNLKAKNPTSIDGGNHLHFGTKSNSLIACLFRDVTNNFFIPWIFTEPDDTESTNNYTITDVLSNKFDVVTLHNTHATINKDNLKKYVNKSLEKAESDFSWGYEYDVAETSLAVVLFHKNIREIDERFYQSGDKMRLIRRSNFGTVEFRFFESTESWEEQEDQLDFAISYMNKVQNDLKAKRIPIPTLYTREELNAFTLPDIITRVKKLLKELNLPYSRYEKYVKRNLIPRWSLERQRM